MKTWQRSVWVATTALGVWALVSAATGEIIGELGALRGVQQHPLPGSPYDHPLALR